MPAVAGTESDVDTLIAVGDNLKAIDLLMQANRRSPDPAVEQRLVGLRHDAFQDLAGVEGRKTWPPVADDPFPDRTGLIEVLPSDLDAELISGALRHHGCLMVRGLLDQPVIDRLTDDIDQAMELHREWQAKVEAAGDQEPVNPASPWFTPFEPNPGHPVPNLEFSRRVVENRVAAADSPRTLFDIIDAVGRSGLLAHAEQYLGTRPVLPANKVAMQKVSPGTMLGWHQETKVFGEPVRAINAWIAVQPCGRDAPGLEFYPQRLPGLIDGEELTPGSYAFTEESIVRSDWSVAPVVPSFDAGDALLFDEWLMHRTEFAPQAIKDRYSFEFWMFAADGIAPHRGPLVC